MSQDNNNPSQFRFSSDGYRQSVRKEVSRKFSREERSFYEIFALHGYKSDSRITKDSPIFKMQSPSSQTSEPNAVLLFFLGLVEQKSSIATVGELISQVVNSIQAMHLDNCEDQTEIETLISYQKFVTDYHHTFNASRIPSQLSFAAQKQNSFLEIYHIQNTANISTLFSFYQIKYRARIITSHHQSINGIPTNNTANANFVHSHQEYKSIYEEKSQSRWREVFADTAQDLELIVLGKRKVPKDEQNSNNNSNNMSLMDSMVDSTIQHQSQDQYIVISRILVSFKMIYGCIHPRSLEGKTVQTKVNIQFKDQTESAPYKGPTTVQIGFSFLLDDLSKITLIDRLQDRYSEDLDKLHQAITERVAIINQALVPFAEKVVYRTSKGLEESKNPQLRAGPCSLQQCKIF